MNTWMLGESLANSCVYKSLSVAFSMAVAYSIKIMNMPGTHAKHLVVKIWAITIRPDVLLLAAVFETTAPGEPLHSLS